MCSWAFVAVPVIQAFGKLEYGGFSCSSGGLREDLRRICVRVGLLMPLPTISVFRGGLGASEELEKTFNPKIMESAI